MTCRDGNCSACLTHNLSISLDGFATGEGQRVDAPMGHAGQRLHEWMFATRFAASILGRQGGTAGVEGAGKFGPPGWQDDADWKGWWGPNPPFHTPPFVLTHRPLPPIEMEAAPPSTSSSRPVSATSQA